MDALPAAAAPSAPRDVPEPAVPMRHGSVVGSVLLLALLVSTQVLFQPNLFDLWTPADVAREWLRYFAEVCLIGGAEGAALAAVARARLPGRIARLAAGAAALLLVPLAVLWLIVWSYSGSWVPAAPTLLAGEVVRFALLGAFMLGLWELQRRAVAAAGAAREAEARRVALEREADAAQLQLLQAQIEPHFLFNTLATVRRLYRRQPAAGAAAIDNLRAYLRAALPQARRSASTLGAEFDLVRAYLELFRLRMGARLRYRLELPGELRATPFPPMVLLTLVENALEHGLAPADLGGTVEIAARRHGSRLTLTVCDDGVGLGAASGGTGVGLVNIRRQLAARYGELARLTLEQRDGGGVVASIRLDGAAAAPTSRAEGAVS